MSIIIGSWVASIITDLLIAVCLTCLGRTMSWYARPLWIFFLYVIPTLLVSMAVILLHAKYYQKDLDLSPWTVFQLYYDAYQLIWTIILLFGVMVRVRSSFIALIWVFFASLGNFLKTRLFGKWRGKNVPTNQEELAQIVAILLSCRVVAGRGATCHS
jgi:hypothetical protein